MTRLHYKHMSPRQWTYVTENVTQNNCKSSRVVGLHCSYIDMGRLRMTHVC
jgi:hypothetical protein